MSLGEDQVKEIRSRLKVTVEVPEGQKPAASPIEAFSEMVRGCPISQVSMPAHQYMCTHHCTSATLPAAAGLGLASMLTNQPWLDRRLACVHITCAIHPFRLLLLTD